MQTTATGESSNHNDCSNDGVGETNGQKVVTERGVKSDRLRLLADQDGKIDCGSSSEAGAGTVSSTGSAEEALASIRAQPAVIEENTGTNMSVCWGEGGGDSGIPNIVVRILRMVVWCATYCACLLVQVWVRGRPYQCVKWPMTRGCGSRRRVSARRRKCLRTGASWGQSWEIHTSARFSPSRGVRIQTVPSSSMSTSSTEHIRRAASKPLTTQET